MQLIRSYHSPLEPFEVYKRLSRCSPVSFFLDSPAYQAPDQCYSYMGANPFLELRLEKNKIYLSGEKRGVYPASDLFKIIRKLLTAYCLLPTFKVPFFTGGMVGYFSYEAVTLFEKIRLRKRGQSKGGAIPLVYFAFYRDLIVYDHKRKHYWIVGNVEFPLTPTLSQFAKKRTDSSSGVREKGKDQDSLPSQGRGQGEGVLHLHPEISQQQFETMVRKAKKYIAAGDIYQANLSQRFFFDYSGDLLELYGKLRTINPSPFSCFLKIRDTAIVSSSPERLIQKRGRLCETRPLAGTRAAPRKKSRGNAVKRDLLGNEKERAEHIMLVDLERNDLGRVCAYKSDQVEEMMVTERYSHVMHIVSKITGRLQKRKDGLDLIKAMFPGGTITGCPKIRCMEIIDELEKSARGLYTGSIGYMDFKGDLDLNIVIRTLVLQKKKGWLQVGAGIVHDSDPAKEYEETLHKGEALVEALALVTGTVLPNPLLHKQLQQTRPFLRKSQKICLLNVKNQGTVLS